MIFRSKLLWVLVLSFGFAPKSKNGALRRYQLLLNVIPDAFASYQSQLYLLFLMKNSFFVIPVSGRDFSLTFLSARPLSAIRQAVQMSLRAWFDGDGREINFGKVREFDTIEALEKEYDLSQKIFPLCGDLRLDWTHRTALIDYQAVTSIVHSCDHENRLARHLFLCLGFAFQ